MDIDSDVVQTIRDYQTLSDICQKLEVWDVDNEYLDESERADIDKLLSRAMDRAHAKIEGVPNGS